jgi:uncharacterized membrane protein required for colicin V production
LPFNIAQALDLLMIAVLVMFIPIGMWRGALREWVALVGITLGTLLAAEWAGPWGGDLAGQTGLDAPLGAFIVGVSFFLGSTLLIGYGGGAALPYRPDLTRANRILGALIALGNGMLILSGVLRLMQRHLFGDQPDSLLVGTTLSRFLIDYVGWAQLLLLGTLLLCVAISALRRWVGGPPLMEEFSPAYYAASSEPVPQPAESWDDDQQDIAWEPEGEPASGPAMPATAGRQGDTAVLHLFPAQANAARIAPAASPAPIAPSAPAPQAPPPPTPAPAPSPRATTLVSVPKVVEITRPAARAPQPVPPLVPPAQANGHAPRDAGGAGVAADDQPTLPTEFPAGITCPVCAQTVAVRSRFCHHCGHIIGEAERRRVARHD